MMKDLNEINRAIAASVKGPEEKDTLGWLLSLIFKFGAGYFLKMILDALNL